MKSLLITAVIVIVIVIVFMYRINVTYLTRNC